MKRERITTRHAITLFGFWLAFIATEAIMFDLEFSLYKGGAAIVLSACLAFQTWDVLEVVRERMS